MLDEESPNGQSRAVTGKSCSKEVSLSMLWGEGTRDGVQGVWIDSASNWKVQLFNKNRLHQCNMGVSVFFSS